MHNGGRKTRGVSVCNILMTEYSKVQNKTRKDQRCLHLQTTSHTDRWRQTAADSSWKQPPYGQRRHEGISFLFFPSSASFLPSFQEGYMFGHAGSQTAPCWATDSSLTTTGAAGSAWCFVLTYSMGSVQQQVQQGCCRTFSTGTRYAFTSTLQRDKTTFDWDNKIH